MYGMSSSRSVAAIASLPHTRSEGWLGTGRSISLPPASADLAEGMFIVFSLSGGGVTNSHRLNRTLCPLAAGKTSAGRQCDEQGSDCGGSEAGANCVKTVPLDDQRPCSGIGINQFRAHQHVVRRPDHQKSPRPIGHYQNSACQEAKLPG